MAESRYNAEAKDRHIMTMRWVIAGFTLIIAMLIVTLLISFKNQRVFIPPNFDNGGQLSFNEVPDVYAYQFALALWQRLNYWENNGSEDYSKNLWRYQGYFTPSCRTTLETQYKALRRRGELKERVRRIQENPKKPYRPEYVESVSAGVWHVSLPIVLKEYVNNTTVKDNDMIYPIRVVYYDVDTDINPWGLAIDCFYDRPEVKRNNLLQVQSNIKEDKRNG